MNYREVELSDPVTQWLKAQGCAVYAEVPFYGRAVDLVGENEDKQIAVELKQCFTQRLKHQAVVLQLATVYVYCAIISKPTKKSLETCKQLGLGLLRVQVSSVEVLLEPEQRIEPSKHWRFKLKYHPKGGQGGLPQLKGCGPAQECFKRVEEYRKMHPKATWREIYENVPNHYASYNSMCGAQRTVKGMLNRREEYND